MADIYFIGESYAATGFLFPYFRQVRDTAPHSLERAEVIVTLACKEFKLEAGVFINQVVLQNSGWLILENYLAKKSSDGEFLAGFRKLLEGLLVNYLKNKK